MWIHPGVSESAESGPQWYLIWQVLGPLTDWYGTNWQITVTLHNRSREFHRTLNRVNQSGDFWDIHSSKLGPKRYHIWQVFFPMGKLIWGKWPWRYTTSGLDNSLTHWGRVTHLCVGKLTIISSDNGLPPGRRQAIIWTNAGILSIGPLGTNFSEILIKICIFSFKKMHLKMSSGIWRPFCFSLNVLSHPSLGSVGFHVRCHNNFASHVKTVWAKTYTFKTKKI